MLPMVKQVLFEWAIPGPFFFILVFSIHLIVNNLPMTGFKPRISGVGSDRSSNWAKTTADSCVFMFCSERLIKDYNMVRVGSPNAKKFV